MSELLYPHSSQIEKIVYVFKFIARFTKTNRKTTISMPNQRNDRFESITSIIHPFVTRLFIGAFSANLAKKNIENDLHASWKIKILKSKLCECVRAISNQSDENKYV